MNRPNVQCISKGMEYKKYEFGSKVSLELTKDSGVCVGCDEFREGPPTGRRDTLPAALDQCERLTRQRPKAALVDLGSSAKNYKDTQILYTGHTYGDFGEYGIAGMQKLHRRASIELRIVHLKGEFLAG